MSARELKEVALTSFFFVILAGAILQLIVLPATPWHAQVGLMAGGDWVYFHRLAVDLASTIRQEGWSNWVSRIEGQAPASVAAAFYVLTGIDQPWVLLPLHGVLYCVTATVLYNIARTLGGTRKQAWLTLLPLFFFPSTAMIWGQIHKDIYSLAGVLLVLRYWFILYFIYLRCKITILALGVELTLLSAGMSLIIFVRPYLALITSLASLILAITLLLNALRQSIRKKEMSVSGRKASSFAILLIMISVGLGLQAVGLSIQKVQSDAEEPKVAKTEPAKNCVTWIPQSYLPKSIDQRLSSFACIRGGFSSDSPGAGTNIDKDVLFSSAVDIVIYLPRALLIGFLAPFPSQWFSDAVQPGGQMMRLMVIPEMLALYLAFPGVLFFLMKSEMQFPTILLITFTITFVVIHSLVVANIGTLYRMRYPAVLVWNLIGLLGWMRWLRLCRAGNT